MTRIAVVSTAHIHAQHFLTELRDHDDGRQIHAIWDDNPDRGQRYAAEFGAPFVDQLEQLAADPAVDGFLICAENTGHRGLLERLIPVGKPILCEKPLVTDADDARTVAALLAQHGTPLCSGWFQPFSAAMVGVRQAIADDACGAITRVRFRNAHHAAYGRWFDSPDLHWFTEPARAGGGAFLDMGAHAIHLLRFLFGPVTSVWATIENHSGVYPAVDDHGLAVLRFANGVQGQVEAAWTQTGGRGGLEIVGATGTIVAGPDGFELERPGAPAEPVAPSTAEPDRVDRLVAMCRGELTAADLAHDLAATVDEALIMAACYSASATGQWHTL